MTNAVQVPLQRSHVATYLGLLLPLICLALPATTQAASWSIQTTPNGVEAEHSALNDISCEPASTNSCTAVGRQTKGGIRTPYAQYWNGSSWVNQSTATPEGATTSELQADHCLSATSCVASGSYTTGSGTFTLVEAWSGTSWSIQTTPNPAGANESKLRGISCKVITACIAVGSSVKEGKQTALAIRGNSGTWSLQTVPMPEAGTASELNGVECTSSTFCVAVGKYNVSGSTYWAMAATWNGTEWSLKTVPKPEGAKRSILLDVSCSDSSNCTAVGGYLNSGSVQVTFVERWNGTSWTLQTSPNPMGSTNSVLQNVTCFDRSGCIAVGDWINAGTWQPMAQSWDGSTWSLDSAANPAGSTFGLLEGVACRVTCIGIGWYTNSEGKDKTLGELREAPTWTKRSIGSSVAASLSGVSCYSASACLAVGTDEFTPRATAYLGAETWTEVFPPKPSESTSAQLRDVSCPSGAGTCMAVGVYIKGGVEKPYAARRSEAGTWTLYDPVPLPVGVTSAVLNDVSCTSASACSAVGDYKSGAIPRTYALSWNGTAWSLKTSPNISESTNILYGVSCTSSSACTAVGYGLVGTTYLPLIERWNGTSWATQSYELPAGGVEGELFGVSCTTSTDCFAVGRYLSTGGSGRQTLATRWDGTSWSTVVSPYLAFASVSNLAEVSCSSATSCIGIGSYSDSEGTSRTFAAGWNGSSWTYHSAPAAGPITGTLLGITCLNSTTCRAVGQAGGQNLALTYP
jgi:hypothetical protein